MDFNSLGQINQIKGKLYLAMELVQDGRLSDLIKKIVEDNKKFSDKDASALIRGILSAVAYMHDKGIVHRDLKPGTNNLFLIDSSPFLENILIQDKRDLSTVKVVDFGLSAKYSAS